jgi:hypothetical protein
MPRVGYMAFKWTVLPLRKFGGVFFTRRVAYGIRPIIMTKEDERPAFTDKM